jgi:hypothetical protein
MVFRSDLNNSTNNNDSTFYNYSSDGFNTHFTQPELIIRDVKDRQYIKAGNFDRTPYYTQTELDHINVNGFDDNDELTGGRGANAFLKI